MNELIKFTPKTTDNGQKGVSARQLYKFLNPNGRNFARWVERNIVKNQYIVKNTDWVEVSETPTNLGSQSAQPRNLPISANTKYSGSKDYILSPETAKRLCYSIKSPIQAQIINAITEQLEKQSKEPMVPVSMIEEIVRKTMAAQSGKVGNYNQLMIENQEKDKTIESLTLQAKARHNATASQNAIRQIVNIIVNNSYWAGQENAYQVVYNKIMADYFRTHPVHWRSDWYALKNAEFRKKEFRRIFESGGEHVESKLDWVRIVHPSALQDIENAARSYAVFVLPQDFFLGGGRLPA